MQIVNNLVRDCLRAEWRPEIRVILLEAEDGYILMALR
jgi:hypothetical protein